MMAKISNRIKKHPKGVPGLWIFLVYFEIHFYLFKTETFLWGKKKRLIYLKNISGNIVSGSASQDQAVSIFEKLKWIICAQFESLRCPKWWLVKQQEVQLCKTNVNRVSCLWRIINLSYRWNALLVSIDTWLDFSTYYANCTLLALNLCLCITEDRSREKLRLWSENT